MRECGRGDARAGAEGVWEAFVPGIELGFEAVPAFEEDMLGDTEGAGDDCILIEVHVVTGADEVHDFGEDPDECVGD